jgi:hypothetical protein
MGLKKLGQDATITINSNTSSYLRNINSNNNQGQVDTTGLADAATGYKTYQAGARDIEITGEIMHPADGEPADQVFTDITDAIDAGGTVDVVLDGQSYPNMSVIGGETTYEVDQPVATKFTLKLTEAPAS